MAEPEAQEHNFGDQVASSELRQANPEIGQKLLADTFSDNLKSTNANWTSDPEIFKPELSIDLRNPADLFETARRGSDRTRFGEFDLFGKPRLDPRTNEFIIPGKNGQPDVRIPRQVEADGTEVWRWQPRDANGQVDPNGYYEIRMRGRQSGGNVEASIRMKDGNDETLMIFNRDAGVIQSYINGRPSFIRDRDSVRIYNPESNSDLPAMEKDLRTGTITRRLEDGSIETTTRDSNTSQNRITILDPNTGERRERMPDARLPNGSRLTDLAERDGALYARFSDGTRARVEFDANGDFVARRGNRTTRLNVQENSWTEHYLASRLVMLQMQKPLGTGRSGGR